MVIQRIPLIYILGIDRSGSTLLDLLLGAHPQIWTLGEVDRLPKLLYEHIQPCGCGQPLEKCAFWSDILPSVPLGERETSIGYFAVNPLRSREFRWNLLVDLLRGHPTDAEEQAYCDYVRNNVKLFKVIQAALNAKVSKDILWMVDASKNPNRLYWLKQSQQFDIRVIRLVRDVRGFVNSVTRPDYDRRMILLSARRWLFNNFIYVLLCKRLFTADQVFPVRYRTLANQPAATLESIGNWLGLAFPAGTHEHFREYENHGISGNQTRWMKSGIYLDEKWKEELPWLDSLLVNTLTWPFRTVLGI